ncbi:hypothetical protein P5V15_010231 [Pogonomyrmex californicus]
MDEEDFVNIVDEVFENEEEMEVDNIDNIDIDIEDEEHTLSDDSNYVSDQSDDLTDYAEKIVTHSELLALNNNKKYCSVQFYYSTGGALTVCRMHARFRNMEHLERVERKLLEQCSQVATLVECFVWLQRCEECIELEELSRVKRPRLTVANRQSVVARIARLVSAKVQLERRFVHVGGESRVETGSLVWRQIDTAFESHILTGAVINVDYIEP